MRLALPWCFRFLQWQGRWSRSCWPSCLGYWGCLGFVSGAGSAARADNLKIMTGMGRRFEGSGALKFLSCIRRRIQFLGYLSKSMGVGSLNRKAMLSMCFYLCPVFSLSFFHFVFFFCYKVIHLRWMTVVIYLQSPPGKSQLIRFSP